MEGCGPPIKLASFPAQFVIPGQQGEGFGIHNSSAEVTDSRPAAPRRSE